MSIGTVARRFVGLALAVPFAVSLAAAQKEPESITRVTHWIVKPGMKAKLEEGIKKHNEWHRKQNDTWTLSTWTIETGKDSGHYVRITGRHRWADFDLEEQSGPADDADSAVNLDPYHDVGGTAFYEMLPSLSRPPEEGPPALFAEVLTFKLKVEGQREFRAQMKRVHEAIQKTSWPVRYVWYALANGGEDPTYVLVLPHKNWAEMKGPETSFGAMLEQAYGRDEAEATMRDIDASIRMRSSEILRYHADLSYVPK
jgi:hypothetical protein